MGLRRRGPGQVTERHVCRCCVCLQERFAKKNEAEDLRRAFDKLDSKGYARTRGDLFCPLQGCAARNSHLTACTIAHRHPSTAPSVRRRATTRWHV
jgi:hypothetical protein